jgi:uncharacterized protein YbjT (DUF2867 family)
MKTKKIVVAGGTGNVGTHLIANLVRAGHSVRALVRDPARARTLLGRHVEIVTGDLDEPASLRGAFDGAAIAFVATAPTPALDVQEIHFIDAARAASVERVVKLSGFGIEFSTDSIHRAHARSESRLSDSRMPSVVLRPVVYVSNLLFDAASIKTGKLPSIFGDGRISLIQPRDVAEVAARALTTPDYEGQTLDLGGAVALSYDDVAATFTRVLGRPIERVRMGDAAFEVAALGAGLPDFVVEAITTTASSARSGKYEVSDAVVQRVLGRPAAGLAEWITEHREAFETGR